jgi:DNA-binding MarR family transcriptional regulator
LRKVTRLVTQLYDAALAGTGLTITQYGILGHLKRLDGIALGELAEVLVMDATTLVRTLKPLENRGYIASAVRADDRRTRRLHLTGAGLQAYDTAKPHWRRAQARIDAVLGQEGAAQLASSVSTLLAALPLDATSTATSST